MTGAVLRASGSQANVRRFLEQTRWQPISVYWKGKPRTANSVRPSEVNGFNVLVSEAPGTMLGRQIDDAARFIQRHVAELRRLRRFRLRSVLDFGVEARPEAAATFYRVPAKFMRTLALHEVDLEISYYDIGEDDC